MLGLHSLLCVVLPFDLASSYWALVCVCGCLSDALLPLVARAALAVLLRLGLPQTSDSPTCGPSLNQTDSGTGGYHSGGYNGRKTPRHSVPVMV